MPEPGILLCAPALDATESAAGLARLDAVNLPNAARYVVTHGKFDTQKRANTFNAEAGYPADPAWLATLAAWAGQPDDQRRRDGFDLFCLRGILAREQGVDLAILVRDPAGVEQLAADAHGHLRGRLFATFGREPSGTSLLFDCRGGRSAQLLEFAWTLYRTGAVYGLEPYSISAALDAAAKALLMTGEVA